MTLALCRLAKLLLVRLRENLMLKFINFLFKAFILELRQFYFASWLTSAALYVIVHASLNKMSLL